MGLTRRGDLWLARHSRQVNGRQKEIAKRFRLKADAERWLRQRETEAERGVPFLPPARITLNAWADEWLNGRRGVRHRTVADARAVLQRYWREPLGDTRLDHLSAEAIQRVLTAMVDRGLSPRTIQQALAVLHTLLEAAVKRRKLVVNPASLVDRDELPAQVRAERVVWHRADVRDFLDATAADPLGALWAVQLWTGLRPSESLALRWSDLMLDAAEPYLRVMRTLYRPKDATQAWRWEDTKTDLSRSPVPLVAPAVAALKRHRDRQQVERVISGPSYAAHDLVFSDERGEPLRPDVVSKQWQRAIAKVNAARAAATAAGRDPVVLRPMRLYDCRHTCATLLLEAGVAMRVVQEILRHSSMTLTANTYSHVRPVVARQAMAQLEDFVHGTDKTRTTGPDGQGDVS
jgi:integrase